MTENNIQDELNQDFGTHQTGDNPLARKYRFSRVLILVLLVVNVLLSFSKLDQISMFIAGITTPFLLFLVGVRIYKKEILPLAYLNIYSIISYCIYKGVVFANAEYWLWGLMICCVLDSIIFILTYKHLARCGVPYTVVLYFAVLIIRLCNIMLIPQILITNSVSEVFVYLEKLLPIIFVIMIWFMLRSDMMYKSEAGFKLEKPKLYLSFKDVCITIISILLTGGLGWLALTYGGSIPSII